VCTCGWRLDALRAVGGRLLTRLLCDCTRCGLACDYMIPTDECDFELKDFLGCMAATANVSQCRPEQLALTRCVQKTDLAMVRCRLVVLVL